MSLLLLFQQNLALPAFALAPAARRVTAGRQSGRAEPARTFVKDPDEFLDYSVDYSKSLQPGEAIASSVWALTGPDTSLQDTITTAGASATTAWCLAGNEGSTYTLTNRVVTDSLPARTYECSFRILVRSSAS